MKLTSTFGTDKVRQSLVDVRGAVADKTSLLKIFGELMRASIARTFRDEGSPAGSWPQLAASTLRSHRYKGFHKLLVLSGRLFGSISYTVDGNSLTVGTALAYASVHQYGSADRRGGSIGAQSRISGRSVTVGAYTRLRAIYYGTREVTLGSGRVVRVPVAMNAGKSGRKKVAYEGPRQLMDVRAHERFANIPARPFVVFRPEDPARLLEATQAYLAHRGGAQIVGGAA
ncbi:phage virion morphogenesis protein [Granulicella cerasi]|uniref:Phage virion morphogenesis protein n=1 Tax=Granulicella cerasi TaxID=741063 RepID=A0ABW1Z983_9BACT|nr:phage virion morphogenesis protein [Granulicella cerasi]